MAEKEERIWLEFDIPKPKGAVEATRCTTMTRQEAIERMAKAICNMGDEETWGRVDDNYKHYCTAQAEWALNALLGGK